MATIAISSLESTKAQLFKHALLNVLESKPCSMAMALLIDGLPTYDIWVRSGGDLGRPDLVSRDSASNGAFAEFKEFTEKLDVYNLQFNVEVS
jgi:hypothetical protein